MLCDHNSSDWASFVAPNGDFFHVCRPRGKEYVLAAGSPGSGYGHSFDLERETADVIAVAPEQFRKLGW